MGGGNAMPFLRYGKKFQKHRQLFQEYFSRSKVAGYAEMQVVQARQLALSLAGGKEDKESLLKK
jgi:cytochrome P450